MYKKSVNKKRAFTLIELLVVIAIIALLLSVLMPSLSKAREAAKSVICSTRLRQIGLGIMLYSEANDGYIVNPRKYVPTSYTGWKAGGQIFWWNLLVPYLQDFTEAEKTTVYFCPSRKGYYVDVGSPFNEERTRIPDYSINNVGLGDLRADPSSREFQVWNPPSPQYWKDRTALRMNKVRSLSTYVGVFDWVNFNTGADPGIEGPMHLCQCVALYTGPGGLWETAYGVTLTEKDFCRHNDAMNFVFLDGHVGHFKREYLGLELEYALTQYTGPIHSDMKWNRKDFSSHQWTW